MNKLLLIGSASATAITALQEGYGCSSTALEEDTSNSVYSAPVELQATGSGVTAVTCFSTANTLASESNAANGKRACVEIIADEATAGNNICQMIHEVGTTDASWDPTACEEGVSSGIITFSGAEGGTWDAATTIDCTPDDTAADDDDTGTGGKGLLGGLGHDAGLRF